ncbi:MAG: endonuclease domain-containing protein [Ignavibacteria bacterium]|nr:endonuclease domain-containing protein [Ignavibacteria bacterium]
MSDYSNNYYNKNLKEKANDLRKSMTKAEACLWKYLLKAKLMKGYQFRRQRPILNYIVDFVCLELKLVIEVDGVTHNFDNIIKRDLIRQKDIENMGFKVIRFQDKEILGNLEGVRISIYDTICDIERTYPPPAPASGGHRC